MACENCLHYLVCPDSKNRIISGCPFFSDKSEWVNLPCKVGDTLYEITSRKTISEYKVKAVRVELFGMFIDWEITKGFVDKYITNVPVSEIGKTIFLTREEAEENIMLGEYRIDDDRPTEKGGEQG